MTQTHVCGRVFLVGKLVEVRQFLEIFNFCHFLLSAKLVSAKLVSAI
jgi:hypothetical protein